MMLYYCDESLLKKIDYNAQQAIDENVIWIDMVRPSPQEEKAVEEFLHIDIPTREEMNEIELSSILYQENGAIYMTFKIVTNADSSEPETQACTCVIAGNRLITIRYSEPKPFAQFIAKAEKLPAYAQTGQELFIGLIESIIARLADILEFMGNDLNAITRSIFKPRSESESKPNYQSVLERIGAKGDLGSKIRESLMTLDRTISYALQSKQTYMEDEAHKQLEILSHDVMALSDHLSFLSNKINFLLDATLGMINIEQNAIIKIFSVASVVFLPPTLIASLYGMNFEHMPELKWHLGYPLALVAMVLSSLIPYVYFKRRKWL